MSRQPVGIPHKVSRPSRIVPLSPRHIPHRCATRPSMKSPVRHTLISLLRSRRRLIGLIPLLILLALSVSMECHAVGPRDAGVHGTSREPLSAGQTDAPCCPMDGHDHGDMDHCDSCLHCACHAPLMQFVTLLSYAPSLSLLNPGERSNQLPEVYLPIFSPPQNRA